MILSSIRQSFERHLQTLPGLKAEDVAWENVAFRPTKGRLYLAPQLSGRNRTPIGVGSDALQQWQGFYQVNVNGPVGMGMRDIEARADALLDLFARGLRLTGCDCTVVQVTSSTAQSPIAANDWVTVPVVIAWFVLEAPRAP